MPRWHDGELYSDLMQRSMPYRIILPPNYDYSMLSFPALYLLHGLYGSFENWTDLTDIASYAAQHQLIIVMPEGENGWYTDGCNAEDTYESYLIRELVPAIDERLRTIKTREGRGISGLSMGGYGAIKFALKFPRMFAFAGSVSGAFDVTRWREGFPEWEEFGPIITTIFGKPGSGKRSANDLEKIADGISKTAIGDLPYIYFDCGIDDTFIDANKRLSDTFEGVGIVHEFHALNGGHDWQYWNERGRVLLELAVGRLSSPVRLG